MKNNVGFRQELTIKANEYETNVSIAKEIEDIKNKLESCFYKREFFIYLIKVTRSPVALGCCDSSCTNIFVPHGISPLHYRQLFVNELQELGFSEEYMELSIEERPCFDSYNIKLKW